MVKVPGLMVSTGSVATSPANTVTKVPLVAFGAVEVNSAVLLINPLVAPMLATSFATAPGAQNLARRKVVLLRVLV